MDSRKAHERDLLELTQQLEVANAALERLSSLDGLTGLLNRRELDLLLEQASNSSVLTGTPIAASMIDIDKFKAYNYQYGHVEGDAYLKQVAGALKQTLHRGTDILARYWGDEFALVLPATGRNGAKTVGEALRSAVEALDIPHTASQVSSCVTFSVGVASVVPHPATVPLALIGAADAALYQAKHEGRNRVAVAQGGADQF